MDIVETTSTVIAGHENSTCPTILDEWFSDAGQVEILKSVNAFFIFYLIYGMLLKAERVVIL